MEPLIRKKIGQLLCELGYLEPDQLREALERQSSDPRRLGQILLELKYISPPQLNEALSIQAGIERVDVTTLQVDGRVVATIPAEVVSRHRVLPLRQENGKLSVAMSDPFDTRIMEDLRIVTGLSIRRFYSHPTELEDAIARYYGSNVARMLKNLAPGEALENAADIDDNGDFSPSRLHELAREPSLVNLVNLIVLEAIDARASDVHIEPFEKHIKIKYRIDGLLVEKAPSPRRLHAAIVSRVKIMANMNIAERFIPQDGHIEFAGKNGKIDIRVSTVPSIFGESVTMRILDRSASLISLEYLGMNGLTLEGFGQATAKVHGIVLVTGPTGSGKTTTLYAALNKIYTPTLKIITIEDPVEYQLEGIVQMPVNPKRGLTFANGLRHILRQDPDIIMVGEIRDRETADIAVRAALTGHLVLSTLHTNDAPGAVTRLIDMGVEPFLLASSIEAVLAQRLVRTICNECKQPYIPDASVVRSLNNSIVIPPGTPFYQGQGCNECMHSGMRGRTGIFELLRINESLRQLISSRPSTDQIVKSAPADHVCMRHDGIEKILAGVTTPEEVLRVTQGSEEN